MSYNLKECQKWIDHVENTKMAKFFAPGIRVTLWDSFSFRKIFEDSVWKTSLERSNNFFQTNPLIFQKLQTLIKSHSLMAGALRFGHFDIFDMLLQFLAYVKS